MSRHSHTEIERCKRIASKMNVETGEAKAHSLHLLVRRTRGNRLKGFWKTLPRYEAWMSLANSASLTANDYAGGLKNLGIPATDPLWKDVNRWNKLFRFAFRRARFMRPDHVRIYRD